MKNVKKKRPGMSISKLTAATSNLKVWKTPLQFISNVTNPTFIILS